MEAIRHIITPSSVNLQIVLPENLVNERLEVIILQVDEPKEIKSYKSLRGKISASEAEKMLSHLEESRNEWE